MEKQNWHLIHLHHIPGVTRNLLKKVLKKDPALEQIYHWDQNFWLETFHLDNKRATIIYSQLHSKEVKKEVVQHANKFTILTILDKEYPPSLKAIPDPPLVLYLHGDKKLLTYSPNLSVVGTRYPSRHAFPMMKKILSPLIDRNFVITSGMAIGIDGFAHQLVLENKGRTIAVLGSGFYHIYPKQHYQLFHQLGKDNLIISEYPPDQPPKKYHFPERNRIISGLSFGTLVIEAKQKSGTLITVDQALEQGKEVFALPGSILSETSVGCNQLIQDGAKLVQTSEDILEESPLHTITRQARI